jgi:outer membrane protein assembly factor BamB
LLRKLLTAAVISIMLALAAGCGKDTPPTGETQSAGTSAQQGAESAEMHEQEGVQPADADVAEGAAGSGDAAGTGGSAGPEAGQESGAGPDTGQSIEGVVIYLAGEVTAEADGGWNPIDVDDTVGGGDRIRTGPESFCEVQFTDFGLIRINQNTEVQVATLFLSEEKNKVGIKLDEGGVLCKVRKLKKQDEEFTVSTSTSLAGVRGTEFAVTEQAGESTVVAVNEGEVSVVPARIAEAFDEIRGQAATDASRAAVEALQLPEVIVATEQEVTFEPETVEQAVQEFEEQTAQIKEKITLIDEKVESVQNTEQAVAAGDRKVGRRELKEAENLKQEVALLQEEVSGASRAISSSVVTKLQKPAAVSGEGKKVLEDIRKMQPVQIASAGKQERAYTRLVVEARPDDALITVDGDESGRGTFKGLFEPGTRLFIEVSREGYRTEQRKVTVSTDREQRIVIDLQSPVSWRSRPGSGVFVRGAAVFGEKVVLADSRGMLVCLDSRGRTSWTVKTGNAPNNNSAPVGAGDRAVFTGSEELVAVNVRDGKVVHRIDLADQGFSDHLFGRKVAALDKYLLYPSDQVLQVLRYDDFEKMSSVPIPGAFSSSVTLDRGRAFLVNLKGELVVVDPLQGRVLQRIGTGAFQAVATAPLVDENRAVFADHRGTVVSVDLSRESVVWEHPLPEGSAGVYQDIEASAGTLYVFTGDRFHAINREDGGARFGPVQSTCPPLYHRGKLYFGDRTSRFTVMDAESGRVLKWWNLDGPLTMRPALFRDRVLAATDNGFVYLLEPDLM